MTSLNKALNAIKMNRILRAENNSLRTENERLRLELKQIKEDAVNGRALERANKRQQRGDPKWG